MGRRRSLERQRRKTRGEHAWKYGEWRRGTDDPYITRFGGGGVVGVWRRCFQGRGRRVGSNLELVCLRPHVGSSSLHAKVAKASIIAVR